ncbi:MAG: hypothetical protein ACOC8X_10190 [Chloroflexota bacterium]
MKTVIGVFMDTTQAEDAVDALMEAGFDGDELSLLAQREALDEVIDDDREESAVESASAGALGGSALGGLIGLIAGASTLVVPGIGPALAAGTWATVLGTTAAGAGVGAAYGGLVGGLIGFGVAEEETHVYVEGIEKGGVLIVVQPEDPDRLTTAKNIMNEHDGIGVDVVQQPSTS